MTDCVHCRLCSMSRRTDRASRLGKGVYRMDLMSRNRLQWVLSGALGASLALAPALVASAQQTAQQTPTPGQQGDWGQAGPPPDAQNGQIPPPDSAAQDQNQTKSGPGPAPISWPERKSRSEPGTEPVSDQGPGAPPAGAGVGYGQPPRPAYQPGQNQPNGYQGPQGAAQAAPPSGPVTLASWIAAADSHQ